MLIDYSLNKIIRLGDKRLAHTKMKTLKTIVSNLNFKNKNGANLKLDNAFLMYEICTVFINKKAKMQALDYIERWFCFAVENKKHVDLRFGLFRKLCASSNLNTTSEMEIVNAAESWIKHNPKARSGFAVDLLKQVRLPLLSPAAINNLLREKNSFSRCKKCREYMKSAPRSVEKQLSIDPASVNLQNRYCGQENFDVLAYGWFAFWSPRLPNVHQSSNVSKLPAEEAAFVQSDFVRLSRKLVVVNKSIFTFGIGKRGVLINSYSICTKEWSKPKTIVGQYVMNACVLMNKIYIHCSNGSTKNCFVCFHPKSGKLEKRAAMMGLRECQTFCVFGGRVVAAGGDFLHYRSERSGPERILTRTVEGYDPFSNQWTRMPDMVHERHPCSTVAVRNKLYVFGPTTSEVFDLISNKFACLEAGWPLFARHRCLIGTLSLGGKIFAFSSAQMAVYSEEGGGEWSEVVESDAQVKMNVNKTTNCCALKLPHY